VLGTPLGAKVERSAETVNDNPSTRAGDESQGREQGPPLQAKGKGEGVEGKGQRGKGRVGVGTEGREGERQGKSDRLG
jgi:hypothetical protein